MHLLGVQASVGVEALDSAGRESQASLVTGGLVNTSVDPDAPRVVDAVGAGEEAGTVEVQVAGVVETPAGELSVAGRRLSSSDVAELALACDAWLAEVQFIVHASSL